MSGPRVGGLFAGYGGLELALHDVLGAEPAWFSEFDKAPSAILAHRWPGVPNLGDITRIDWSAVEPVDIIAGGSPCQDLSHAGKRMGMRPGTRSGLWASMLEAVRVLRPSLVVWENVRGSLSAEATSELEPCAGCVGGDDDGPVLRALGRVLGDLAGIGYDAAWTGIRAADVGAPHGRFRVFVLAWPAADADGTAGDQRWLSAPGQAKGGRARADAGGSDRAPLTLLPTPVVNDMGAGKDPDAWDAWTASMQERHGNGNGHGASLSIEALRMLPTPVASDANDRNASEHWHGHDLVSTVKTLLPTPDASGGDRGPRSVSALASGTHQVNLNDLPRLLPTPTAVTRDRTEAQIEGRRVNRPSSGLNLDEVRSIEFGQYAPAVARREAVTRPAPSPTEPTGKGEAGRLSPAFVEWMMGLPDGHVTGPAVWHGWKPTVARNAQLKALGNGVVPQQAAAAIRYLLGVREDALRIAKAVTSL